MMIFVTPTVIGVKLTQQLLGNFSRDEAGDFLKNFADVLCCGDTMLIGIDACDDPAKV